MLKDRLHTPPKLGRALFGERMSLSAMGDAAEQRDGTMSRRTMVSGSAGITALMALGLSLADARAAIGAPAGFNYPFVAPMRDITSSYGNRRHPVTGVWTFHEGTDFGMSSNDSIRSIGAGTVAFNGWSNGGGNILRINHAGGVQSTYMHMATPSPIGNGKAVAAGQHVGPVGSTGAYTTGAHLHLEIRINGATTDPAAWLNGCPFAGQSAIAMPAGLLNREEENMLLIYCGDGQGRYGPIGATYYSIVSDTWRLPIPTMSVATELIPALGRKKADGTSSGWAYNCTYAEWEAFLGLPELKKPGTIPPQTPTT
ncbi:M23 family metallopeptidase [Homoserinimonas sp. A520]